MNDYFVIFKSEILSIDEQQLALRITKSFGMGKYVLRSINYYLGAGEGFAWNNEEFTDSIGTSRNSVEGFKTI